jgi:hypothetical protein
MFFTTVQNEDGRLTRPEDMDSRLAGYADYPTKALVERQLETTFFQELTGLITFFRATPESLDSRRIIELSNETNTHFTDNRTSWINFTAFATLALQLGNTELAHALKSKAYIHYKFHCADEERAPHETQDWPVMTNAITKILHGDQVSEALTELRELEHGSILCRSVFHIVILLHEQNRSDDFMTLMDKIGNLVIQDPATASSKYEYYGSLSVELHMAGLEEFATIALRKVYTLFDNYQNGKEDIPLRTEERYFVPTIPQMKEYLASLLEAGFPPAVAINGERSQQGGGASLPDYMAEEL